MHQETHNWGSIAEALQGPAFSEERGNVFGRGVRGGEAQFLHVALTRRMEEAYSGKLNGCRYGPQDRVDSETVGLFQRYRHLLGITPTAIAQNPRIEIIQFPESTDEASQPSNVKELVSA